MAKVKYKFNPHTLKFDVISHPLRKKIAKIAIHLFVNLLLAATLKRLLTPKPWKQTKIRLKNMHRL